MFGEAGHGALEAVAVQVWHAGECEIVTLVIGLGGGVGLHGGDGGAGDADTDIWGPAGGQKGMVKKQRRRHWTTFLLRPIVYTTELRPPSVIFAVKVAHAR
jgi:hypothetical protein